MMPAAYFRWSLLGAVRRGGVAAAAMLAVTGLVTGFRNAPPPAPPRAGAPAVPKAQSVHGLTTVRYKAAKQTVPVQTGRTFAATATAWPSAGSATVRLAGPTATGLASAPATPELASAASSRLAAVSRLVTA